MQGSGTASVEATIGTIIPDKGCLLIIDNGVYGARMVEITSRLKIRHKVLHYSEQQMPSTEDVDHLLSGDSDITHVAMVHCETTTGMLNPLPDIARIVKKHNRRLIIDAMSSLGGIPIDIAELEIDFLISSANKCIQGVPGFGFLLARCSELEQCQGQARSLSLDMYDQWQCMEKHHGKWRFTSSTHTVRAFAQALQELAKEGGITTRDLRYQDNQSLLVSGMMAAGFQCMLPKEQQSPFIISFYSPDHPEYNFRRFYTLLKQEGFVIYPGRVSNADCFRIGTIGEVCPDDIQRLLQAINQCMYWMK